MILYKQSTYDEFRQECEQLRQIHYLEVVAHRGAGYGFDHDFYEQVEDQGGLRTILAFDDETDECIGYMLNIVHENPHDDTRRQVTMDLTFVKPSYRKQMIGVTLYKLAEADLQNIAPNAVWRTAVPIDGEFSAKKRTGIEYFGFKATERVYEKVLGGE